MKLKILQREDKEMREAIDTKNQADLVLYKLEATKRAGRKCSQLHKENAKAKVNEVMDAISGGSTQAIKDAMAVLNQEIM